MVGVSSGLRLCQPPKCPGTDPVVTATGRLRGLRTEQGFAFKGIPMAKAPLEPTVFAPVAKKPWAGVRDATAHGANAPQPQGVSVPEFAWYWSDIAISEDYCPWLFTPQRWMAKNAPCWCGCLAVRLPWAQAAHARL